MALFWEAKPHCPACRQVGFAVHPRQPRPACPVRPRLPGVTQPPLVLGSHPEGGECLGLASACVGPFPAPQREPPGPNFPLRLEGNLDVSPSANGQTRNVLTEPNVTQDGKRKWRCRGAACDIASVWGPSRLHHSAGPWTPRGEAGARGGTCLRVIGPPRGSAHGSTGPSSAPRQVPWAPKAHREPSLGLKLGSLSVSWCRGHWSRTYRLRAMPLVPDRVFRGHCERGFAAERFSEGPVRCAAVHRAGVFGPGT